jgi:6-phosphogluconate dehydrogenase
VESGEFLNQANNMKALGFIKEHESINNEFKSFKEFHYSIHPYKDEILKYLKTGQTIAVTMNIIRSLFKGDNNIIGGGNLSYRW